MPVKLATDPELSDDPFPRRGRKKDGVIKRSRGAPIKNLVPFFHFYLVFPAKSVRTMAPHAQKLMSTVESYEVRAVNKDAPPFLLASYSLLDLKRAGTSKLRFGEHGTQVGLFCFRLACVSEEVSGRPLHCFLFGGPRLDSPRLGEGRGSWHQAWVA